MMEWAGAQVSTLDFDSSSSIICSTCSSICKDDARQAFEVGSESKIYKIDSKSMPKITSVQILSRKVYLGKYTNNTHDSLFLNKISIAN
jgi:hypothetical protein